MNELVLLAALLRGPAYGYALKKTAGLIFGSRVLHSNLVYPSLKKFAKNGWVEQTTKTQGERGQERKQYRITAAGRKYLLERLGSFDDLEAGDDGAFLFRIAFFDALPREKRTAMIAARKSFLTSRAAQLSKLSEATAPKSFGAVALERVRNLVTDELRWIRLLERKLENKKGDLQCEQLLIAPATASRS
jgi:DNA-binding PadR family transcriptional regulator